jgi:hypothetical protein
VHTAQLDRTVRFWSAEPMKRHHKILLAVGLLVFLAGWFAWSVLLTERDMPEAPAAEQAP